MATANATTPFNDLQGAKLIRHRTMAQFLDAANFPSNINPFGTPSSSTELPQEIYFIDKALQHSISHFKISYNSILKRPNCL